MIDKIWQILTTFTEESQKAALDKCAELGFDIKRGIVSLDESLINLNAVRYVLMDAVEKNKLIQLPITVQKTLLSQLESVSRSMTNLLNGTDEVENLGNYIEQLNVAIWQYGFHNLSDEVLGFQNKMNQLKSQELEIAKTKRELKLANAQKQILENLIKSAEQSTDTIKSLVAKTETIAQNAQANLGNTTKASQEADALLAKVRLNDTGATQLLASTKTSSAGVIALEPKIKEFYAQIEQYKEKVDTTSKQAQETVDSNKAKTEALISDLQKLEDQIKAQIQKATGFSLFHSFQTRQNELSHAKQFWIKAIIGLVVASLGISVFVITTTDNFDVAFYLKLSMSLPLIYAIAFCTVQYGRERKLEEEYAFKSNISISLVPYKELVEKMVDEKQAGEREKFTAFIVDAITKVYTSPTDKVFDSEHKSKSDPDYNIKQLGKIIESLVVPLEPLIKVLKH